jgi:hypothetical protein
MCRSTGLGFCDPLIFGPIRRPTIRLRRAVGDAPSEHGARVARGSLPWQALGIHGGLRRWSRAVPVAMVASQGGGGAALRWWSRSSPAWSEVEDGVLQRMEVAPCGVLSPSCLPVRSWRRIDPCRAWVGQRRRASPDLAADAGCSSAATGTQFHPLLVDTGALAMPATDTSQMYL